MATAITTPQPLTSEEIKEGITVRICAALPDDVAPQLKDAIYASLGRTCSLNSTMYSKFKAKWMLGYVTSPKLVAYWWIDYELDDFGRVTRGGIGGNIGPHDGEHCLTLEGTIEEMPPDKFRRETRQPVPSPAVIKKPDPNQSTMSKSVRGQGKRRDL